MAIEDLRNEVIEEVEAILASDFQIEVTATELVPHSADPAITFPNLDTKTQKTKLIDTCVLYIDIRRSTELNLAHKPKTVSKLYSAFVRAMTRCARYHKGHVRGIIGDRVMVIFDRKDAFANAVNCAIAMNSVSKHVINKHFKHGEVLCGIGIDSGKMLVTKTGVRRKGVEQAAYKNLVWLGRPANVASKLTDLANKPGETVTVKKANVAYVKPGIFADPFDWVWSEEHLATFVQKLTMDNLSYKLSHSDPSFRSMFLLDRNWEMRPETKPILMTETVWNGFKAARPDDPAVVNGWFGEVTLTVPGYSGKVFSGDVIYTQFK